MAIPPLRSSVSPPLQPEAAQLRKASGQEAFFRLARQMGAPPVAAPAVQDAPARPASVSQVPSSDSSAVATAPAVTRVLGEAAPQASGAPGGRIPRPGSIIDIRV